MPPSTSGPGSPQDWLRHAKSDLAVATQPPPEGVLYETLCYHAQQAAEKCLKAVLVDAGVAFPFTHSLARLITIVQNSGVAWDTNLDQAAELTEYAVESRYPGASRQITAGDLQQATELAGRVLAWAEGLIAKP